MKDEMRERRGIWNDGLISIINGEERLADSEI
jgi:hypothetical protein